MRGSAAICMREARPWIEFPTILRGKARGIRAARSQGRMNTTIFNKRRAGLLAPVYALRHPHDFGIGDTLSVKDAIDFCAGSGLQVLQILPILETIGDHSPYSPISSRALSPALLALTPETVPGLTQELIGRFAPESWLHELRQGNVSHEAVQPLKMQLLLGAYYNFFANGDESLKAEFAEFKKAQADWLEPYTLYRLLIREYEGNAQWHHWRPEHRNFQSARSWCQQHHFHEAMDRLRDGFAFVQWVGWRQWKDVRAHATERGVKLIGELTFGVSASSCDVWANPPLFDLSWSMGTRPLAHFDTNKDSERWGQNWGLPAYRWENHRSEGFRWLRGRVSWAKEFLHGCRLDHLRGYFRAYMFPWSGGVKHVEFSHLNESEAALVTGGLLPRFVPGPDDDPHSVKMNEMQGREIISQLIDEAGDLDLVAEIMGDLPEYMARTLEDLQLANLAFPQLEREPDGDIIPPDQFRELGLIAYANHDNAPLASLYLQLREKSINEPESKQARDFHALLDFAGFKGEPPAELDSELLKALQAALFSTSARLAVLMCSDLLGVPVRFNLPGSYGSGTWSDRLEMPLKDFRRHPVFGPRIAAVEEMIPAAGRE